MKWILKRKVKRAEEEIVAAKVALNKFMACPFYKEGITTYFETDYSHPDVMKNRNRFEGNVAKAIEKYNQSLKVLNEYKPRQIFPNITISWK